MERLLERLEVMTALLAEVPQWTGSLREMAGRYEGAAAAAGSMLLLLQTVQGTGLEPPADLYRELQHQAALVRGEILRIAREQGATYRELTEATGMSRPTIVSLITRAERTPLPATSRNGKSASA